MKKELFIPAALLIVAAGFMYFYWPVAPAETLSQQSVLRIEDHIKANISTLSTEQAVLGGTFYVTRISLAPGVEGRGTGVVEYEDGHMAYVADFSYEIDDFRGVSITNFRTRR